MQIKALFAIYAIRRVGTQEYLPSRKTFGGGSTYDKPVLHGGKLGPRLFIKRSSAVMALSAWMRGEWNQEVEWETDEWTGSRYRAFGLPIPPLPEKRRTDVMEVVKFRMEEV